MAENKERKIIIDFNMEEATGILTGLEFTKNYVISILNNKESLDKLLKEYSVSKDTLENILYAIMSVMKKINSTIKEMKT